MWSKWDHASEDTCIVAFLPRTFLLISSDSQNDLSWNMTLEIMILILHID
uniref:FAS-associated factor 2-B-like n=1 Tax=Rhizophora mucronata TaxID=61149 RepID=A0A2P2K8T6_RHIMU